MARMEIVLGDEVFHATLSEEAAPKTVAAVLKALPFEGRAVHAQQSGPATVSHLTPLARLTGDWSAFRAKASAIMFESAKAMTIRKKER